MTSGPMTGRKVTFPLVKMPIPETPGAGDTGIVYSDVGAKNYAPLFAGAWLRRKDGKVRWFKTQQAASDALEQYIMDKPYQEAFGRPMNRF